MSPDTEHWQRWIEPLLAFLAADPSDQSVWSRAHRVRTAAVAEEAGFGVRLAAGMADRGALEPAALADLAEIGRRCDEAARRGGPGHWADGLAADPVWDEVRVLARRVLVGRLGGWDRPLPRRVLPQEVYD
ncbi:hypothetical protein ABZ747_15445 [Kitasatospora cineracea]|uniref:hypothetical protein n=1 Tax=Kitasatospora cineracea TaxID=88074 RepID=UPI0033FD72F5